MLHKKIKQLPGACPVAVQYPKEYADALGKEYTDQVQPVNLKTYYELLKDAEKIVPEGFKTAVNDMVNPHQDPVTVYMGLPLCKDKKFCTVIDSDGNVCMQGAQEQYLEDTRELMKENELLQMQDDNLLLEAAEKLKSNYDSTSETDKKKKLEKLIEEYKKLQQKTSATEDDEIQSISRDNRYHIQAKASEDDNTTYGCGSVYTDKDKASKMVLIDDAVKDKFLGQKPEERKLNIPLTYLEKEQGTYGLGRVPFQRGENAESTVCVTPSNKQMQKKFPILANLLRRVRKKKQSSDNIRSRSIQYTDDHVVSDATKAFICSDLTKKECESDKPFKDLHYKLPFGANDDDSDLNATDICEMKKIPGARSKRKVCIPKNIADDSNTEYGKPFWEWYETDVASGKYKTFAEKKMKDPTNAIQYTVYKPSKFDQIYLSTKESSA